MNKIDDLNTLIRLLKEFEFPVSPILEYAIKEKMEQLSSEGEVPAAVSLVEPKKIDGRIEAPVKSMIGTKKKASNMRVIRTNGTVIECETAANAFCQTIKEIGVKKVYSLKIPMDTMTLVTIGGNPKYPTAQHDVGDGYFVNVHSNVVTKKRQLERIFAVLNISWKVEIVEPN